VPLDAASAFLRALERAREAAHVPIINDALDAYLSVKRTEKTQGTISRLTLIDLESKMRIIRAAFGTQKLSDIDQAAVASFVRKLPHRAQGKRNIVTKFGQFLNYCRREHKWIVGNPAEGLKVKVPRRDVQILDIGQVRRLIDVAISSTHAQSVIPYLVVQTFAGLRPGEAAGLRWESIHFETGQLEVKAATSKTRETRFVPIEPNLAESLLSYRQARGSIIGPGFRNALKAIKREADLLPWHVDILRHCYGSYWLAVHRDRAHLAELMGNSLAVIKSHYRRAIPIEVAKEYWRLRFVSHKPAELIPISDAA